MKTRALLLSAAILLRLAAVAKGEEMKSAGQEANLRTAPATKHLWYGFDLLDIGRIAEKGKIGLESTTTVVSKYIWHGFDLLDDHGAFIPVTTVNFGDSGFSGKIIGVYPLSSGFEKSVELNYAAFYTKSFLEDTRYVTNVTANYFYYGKPKQPGHNGDTQEVGVCLCWPKAFTIADSPLVPSYYAGALWSSEGNSDVRGVEGFVHVLGLAYDLGVTNFWPNGQKQVFRFSGDITYNDGFGGKAVDHDWSHAVIGVSTNLERGSLTITPSLNYQISMDDSVNDEDELWCGLNLTYRF
jgi:hypothetical protein